MAGSYVTKSLTSADNLAISMLIRLDAAPTNSVTVLELRTGSTRMGGIQISSGRTVKLILNGV